MAEETVQVGKYTLESLTTGMYSDPKIVYREYIQNSVDSLSVLAFQKSRGEVIPDLIRFLRCHFSRLKGLTDLVNQYFVLFLFPGEMLVLPF